MHTLSVVIPVFQNEQTLVHLHERLNALKEKNKNGIRFEYVFVDDGSTDSSFRVLSGLAASHPEVKVVRLSRNFGSFVACMAGLQYCTGDCASVMAADLQDPPELLLDMYERWKGGAEVVMAARAGREEGRMKIWFANLYYRVMRVLAFKEMPSQGFDYFLIDRKVVDVLVTMDEKNTSLTGLILWTGFKHSVVYYTKKKRLAGRSQWTLRKKVNYFLDSCLAFSYAPIRLISMIGIIVAVSGFGYMAYAIIRKIFYGVSIQGFTTLVVLVLLTSGVQMLMLGVLGEYLWRNFDATRKRPLFVVKETIGIQRREEAR